MKSISVLKNFSEFPALRHCNISENSGEEFYHKVLNSEFKQVLDSHEKLVVDLDDTAGYASSFLDEAFGNLVYDFGLKTVKKHIEIKSIQEPHWKDMIEDQTFLQWESRRIKGQRPKVTSKHNPWYRMVGKEIKSDIWETPAVA